MLIRVAGVWITARPLKDQTRHLRHDTSEIVTTFVRNKLRREIDVDVTVSVARTHVAIRKMLVANQLPQKIAQMTAVSKGYLNEPSRFVAAATTDQTPITAKPIADTIPRINSDFPGRR